MRETAEPANLPEITDRLVEIRMVEHLLPPMPLEKQGPDFGSDYRGKALGSRRSVRELAL
jgi:hypothetical protein